MHGGCLKVWVRFLGLRLVRVLSPSPALFPEARGLECRSGVGIPTRPRPATARLNLLFLDSSAEKDPGASGRGCLTEEEEISVCVSVAWRMESPPHM